MKGESIAHLRESDGQPQSLQSHLEEVSEVAGMFAEKVGMKECGELVGLMHDLGKASEDFQR